MHFCWNISQHSCEAGREGQIRRFITEHGIVWIVAESQVNLILEHWLTRPGPISAAALIFSFTSNVDCSSVHCVVQHYKWRLLQLDNFWHSPPSSQSNHCAFLMTKISLLAPGWPVSAWLAKIRESWWCQLWSLLIKSATMLSCWDLTWCPSYLQITLHIVHQAVLLTTSLPHNTPDKVILK